MPSVTLYQMPQVVQLTESGAVSVSTVFNRTDFNLFKHVANQVEFLFKTVDRKPATFATTPVIYLVDIRDNKLVAQQTLTPVDVPRGHFRMILDPNLLADLDPGYFRYAITHQDLSGNQFLVYTDQNRKMEGHVELLEGPLPTPHQPIVVPASEFMAERRGPLLETYMVHPTSFPGTAQRNNRSGQHTVAIYANNWSGTFYIEASLENNPPTADTDWFPVSDATFAGMTGIRSIQFTGNYMWVRLSYKNAAGNEGTVTQVLLKN